VPIHRTSHFGKPLALARSLDIPRTVSNLRFFAAAATQFASESHTMEGGAVNYTLRQLLGVVGCISPWNLPLYLFTWKIAPALAAGNSVVAKPSEVTPLTAAMLAERCIEAELPRGILKLTLELGGKNPSIVFADCDFESAVDGAVRAAFANQGEICLCGSRVLIEESLYPRFRDAFVERVRALRVGDPMEPATDQGALVSEKHLHNVLAAVDRAREEGGEVLCGGPRTMVDGARCRDGWFMQPTVIEGLPPDSATNQEEIFGPVATLLPFETESEAPRSGLTLTSPSISPFRCASAARNPPPSARRPRPALRSAWAISSATSSAAEAATAPSIAWSPTATAARRRRSLAP
jgi:aminomuconate-semialdehyde/2-hydroxymuconate-6-semialdehyde dehydrogenase